MSVKKPNKNFWRLVFRAQTDKTVATMSLTVPGDQLSRKLVSEAKEQGWIVVSERC